MPLPPAPTKRASLLASSKFSTTASADKHDKATAKDHKIDDFRSKSASSRRDISLDSYQKHSKTTTIPAAHPVADSLPSYQKVISSTPVQVTTAAAKAKRSKPSGPAKLFVLDTNALKSTTFTCP
jgi:PhoH-like ATPase